MGIGYPAFWLEMLGFDDKSYFPTWVQKASTAPSSLPSDRTHLQESLGKSVFLALPGVATTSLVPVAYTLAMVACGIVGYRFGRRDERRTLQAAKTDGLYASLVA